MTSPAPMAEPPRLTITRGLPGSGKTTVARALAGPWVALLTDQYGWPCEVGEFVEGGEHLPEIAVVRASAAPDPRPGSRRPGSYRSDDLLYERDDFDSPEDLAARWVQAQAVAQALNALAASERDEHVIELRADGWTIMHPLSCRPRLFDCPVNRASGRALTDRPGKLGRFVCALDAAGDLAIDTSPDGMR